MRKPLAVDLFCGLGGWTEGLLANGYDVVGFDIEWHKYDGLGEYPAQLVLQDILTVHGSQFKNADLIVASPPCQEFSYMAMPWSRGKQIAAALRGDISPEGLPMPFPEEYEGSRNRQHLTALFDACFRIQREACAVAGRHIPMVVENVKGAQPWVGRANANYGSFYLWGDIATVNGNIIGLGRIGFDVPILKAPKRSGGKANPDGTSHGQGSWFAIANSKNRGAAQKNGGGSWFNFAHNKGSGVGQNPVNGVKHGGDCFSDPTRPGRQGGSTKTVGHINKRDGHGHTRHLTNQRESDAVKQPGLSGPAWFDQASVSSKSNARKAASAAIAKIPPALAEYVGRFYFPGSLTPCGLCGAEIVGGEE